VTALVILNPYAASGRAQAIFNSIEPTLKASLQDDLHLIVTESPDSVAQHVTHAYQSGIRRVISIGGDGTNHSLVNALASLPNVDDPMVYSSIPVGTGRDWSRGLGTPLNAAQASHALAAKAPRQIDLGHALIDGKHEEYFLNSASMGLGGRVVEKVNSLQTRHPWSFLWSAVTSILSYAPQSVQITVDGKAWYGGTAFLVAVMNGNTFGRGMQIAPNAKVDDGLLEVVLVRGVSRLEILSALWQVYAATHLTHPAVLYCQAHEVRIQSTAKMPFELDGEYMSGNDVTLRVKDGALSLLG